MEKRTLFARLQMHRSQYQQLHMRTAEMDMLILEQLSKGRSATQIALETPCSEATVYRAIGRAKGFLKE